MVPGGSRANRWGDAGVANPMPGVQMLARRLNTRCVWNVLPVVRLGMGLRLAARVLGKGVVDHAWPVIIVAFKHEQFEQRGRDASCAVVNQCAARALQGALAPMRKAKRPTRRRAFRSGPTIYRRSVWRTRASAAAYDGIFGPRMYACAVAAAVTYPVFQRPGRRPSSVTPDASAPSAS